MGVWDSPNAIKQHFPTYYTITHLDSEAPPGGCKNLFSYFYPPPRFALQKNAILKGISISGYALYRAAVTLYTAQPAITLSEMADPELVDDDTFRLIINAMLIARYGIAALRLKKEEPTNEQ